MTFRDLVEDNRETKSRVLGRFQQEPRVDGLKAALKDQSNIGQLVVLLVLVGKDKRQLCTRA